MLLLPARHPLDARAASSPAGLVRALPDHPALGYGLALVIGALAAFWMLTGPTVAGTGGLWDQPGRDLAQNLTGHLAGQAGPLRWPPLVSGHLNWPEGLSIAMTDSNPLLTLWGRAIASATASAPRNWLGAWLAMCWVLQPVAAVYALRGIFPWLAPGHARRPGAACPLDAALLAAVLAVSTPALLARYPHINLLGHFVLLAALGLVARMLNGTGGWRRATLIQLVTILIHPYLFVFNAVLFGAPVLARATTWSRLRRAAGGWLLAAVGPMAVLVLLSGGLGGGDKGFGFYSMNLLSPVWPQRSGVFGPDLPVLDATGGQYEGFNYLGAGALLLVAASIPAWRGMEWRRLAPLLAVLAGLTLLAVTPRVFAGPWLLIPLGTWPWDQVFGVVRASGRAFWSVGYAITLLAVARLAGVLHGPWRAVLLASAALLQLVDTAPLRLEAQGYYAAGEASPVPIPVLPAGMTLLRTAPVCLPAGNLANLPDLLRLRAVQAGAAVADMRASRQPRSFNCESALSDALETPIQPGEVRALIGPAIPLVRPEAFGPGVTCRSQADVLLCGRDVVPAGLPTPAGAPLPRLAAPARLEGAALAPILATGWKQGPDGAAWSEGPRASLLLVIGGTPAGTPASASGTMMLTLVLRGIGPRPGEPRNVLVRVGQAPPRTIALPDQVTSTLRLALPWPGAAEAPLQIAFDLYRPLDPHRRGIDAPANRVGLVLTGATLVSTPPKAARVERGL